MRNTGRDLQNSKNFHFGTTTWDLPVFDSVLLLEITSIRIISNCTVSSAFAEKSEILTGFLELSAWRQPHEVDTPVLPYLLMTKLRRRNVNNLPKMTLLMSGIARISAHACWLQSLLLLTWSLITPWNKNNHCGSHSTLMGPVCTWACCSLNS